jgi:thiol-disulfide isomerase/thioredoxin
MSFSKSSVLLRFLVLAGLVWTAGCSRDEGKAAASASAASTAAAKSSASAAVSAAPNASNLPKLGEAPVWTLRRLDGTELKSADLRGKVVVIDFWATWCPPCREEIPGYIAMQQELAAKGLVIVGVSLDQGGPKIVRDFAQKMGINYDLVMGDDALVEAFGGIEAIPTTFLIDRDGQVRHRKMGSMDRSDYEPLVRSLL